MEKIVLGLSGGVDSAVVASILRERGYEVYGLYLDIVEGAKDDAIAVAKMLDIPLKVLDIADKLEENVCSKFAACYLNGETPNPCIMCNPSVKFPSLLAHADEIGAKFVATGHYAICENGKLFKGKPSNDQSYMLSRLTNSQLARCVFPLGEMEKMQVRELAKNIELPVANKPDSMEICFVKNGDYADFIEKRGQTPPVGNFVDNDGKVLGQHGGIHKYTIGQRRGLGISLGKRIFVSNINPENNTVTLSDDDELHVTKISAHSANWLIDFPPEGLDCEVRVRHSKTSASGKIVPTESGFDVFFDSPVRAPTAGQSAVGYIENQVVCSAYIEKGV